MREFLLAGRSIGRPGRGGSFVIAQWTAEPGASDEPLAPRHRHHHDDEAWYVLSGRLCVEIDGVEEIAVAGGALLAPAGSVHTFWNPGPDDCEYLLVMTPRIAGLIEALHPGDAGAERAGLFAAYDSELVTG